MPTDPFNLQRFVTAQDPVWSTVLAELQAGAKRSHWMWFVFPQLRGLGVSPTARFYGLETLDEAQAYLAHPVLGARLIRATRTVSAVAGRTLNQIFGSPDDMKFRSSMTLFEVAAGDSAKPFRDALDRFCAGGRDSRTLELLGHTKAP